MKNKIIHIFLFLLIAAVALSPRFHFGLLSNGFRNIDIRAEDILLFLGIIIWLSYALISGEHKFRLPPLFWPIFSLSVFGFFSILINLLLGNIVFDVAFFYFLKELEFFIFYFFVFWCVNNSNISKQLMKYWLIFGLVNVIWLVYVFVYKVKWSTYYGPEAFIEPQGPFPSGGFFLLIFIFLFNIFLFYYCKLKIPKIKKIIFLLLSIIPVLGVVSSGSMASTLGLFVSLFISLLLFFIFENHNFMGAIKIFFFTSLIISLLFLIFSLSPGLKKVVSSKKVIWEYSSGSSESRGGIFRNNLFLFLNRPELLFVGIGIFGEAHSQYMRILLERGIIGLCLFGWLIFSILKISFYGFKEKKDLYKKSLSAGLLAATMAMLVMSVPNDAFMVVKVDEVYWFFAALMMSTISKTVEQKYDILK